MGSARVRCEQSTCSQPPPHRPPARGPTPETFALPPAAPSGPAPGGPSAVPRGPATKMCLGHGLLSAGARTPCPRLAARPYRTNSGGTGSVHVRAPPCMPPLPAPAARPRRARGTGRRGGAGGRRRACRYEYGRQSSTRCPVLTCPVHSLSCPRVLRTVGRHTNALTISCPHLRPHLRPHPPSAVGARARAWSLECLRARKRPRRQRPGPLASLEQGPPPSTRRRYAMAPTRANGRGRHAGAGCGRVDACVVRRPAPDHASRCRRLPRHPGGKQPGGTRETGHDGPSKSHARVRRGVRVRVRSRRSGLSVRPPVWVSATMGESETPHPSIRVLGSGRAACMRPRSPPPPPRPINVRQQRCRPWPSRRTSARTCMGAPAHPHALGGRARQRRPSLLVPSTPSSDNGAGRRRRGARRRAAAATARTGAPVCRRLVLALFLGRRQPGQAGHDRREQKQKGQEKNQPCYMQTTNAKPSRVRHDTEQAPPPPPAKLRPARRRQRQRRLPRPRRRPSCPCPRRRGR